MKNYVTNACDTGLIIMESEAWATPSSAQADSWLCSGNTPGSAPYCSSSVLGIQDLIACLEVRKKVGPRKSFCT